jgi:hypothetical protein
VLIYVFIYLHRTDKHDCVIYNCAEYYCPIVSNFIYCEHISTNQLTAYRYLFLPLHPAVLVPGFDLDLRQTEAVGQFDAVGGGEVLLCVKPPL